jgi:hypothetical protein
MMDRTRDYGHFVELYEPTPILLGVYELVRCRAGIRRHRPHPVVQTLVNRRNRRGQIIAREAWRNSRVSPRAKEQAK